MGHRGAIKSAWQRTARRKYGRVLGVVRLLERVPHRTYSTLARTGKRLCVGKQCTGAPPAVPGRPWKYAGSFHSCLPVFGLALGLLRLAPPRDGTARNSA